MCLVYLLLICLPFFQFYGTMVIFKDKITTYLVLLLFQEVSGPDHLGQDISHSNKLILSWTLGVKFLFSRLDIG